jgi:hypothetical protein
MNTKGDKIMPSGIYTRTPKGRANLAKAKYKQELHIPETRICACGCKETFECFTVSKKQFINGHSRIGKQLTPKHKAILLKIRYKPENHIMETRYCACPGHEPFVCATISKKKYVNGHCRKGADHSKENNPNWLGGIGSLPYATEWTEPFRETIRERDNHTCQKCFKTTNNNRNKKLCVHHIDYNKKNCSPINLITLCTSCNCKVNTKRKYWTEFFSAKMQKLEEYILFLNGAKNLAPAYL